MREFVRDYMKNAILTNHGIQDSLLPMVFMPLALGGLDHYSKSEVKKIGCIYGRLDRPKEVIPGRAVNGYPIFIACGFIHKDDWKRIAAAIERERKFEAERKIEI